MQESIQNQQPVPPTRPEVQPTPPIQTQPQSKSKSPLLFIAITFNVLLLLILGVGIYYSLTKDNDDNKSDTNIITTTCDYNNTTYNEGESFDATDGCNTCTCSEGNAMCSLKPCLEPTTKLLSNTTPTLEITNQPEENCEEVKYEMGIIKDITKEGENYKITIQTIEWADTNDPNWQGDGYWFDFTNSKILTLTTAKSFYFGRFPFETIDCSIPEDNNIPNALEFQITGSAEELFIFNQCRKALPINFLHHSGTIYSANQIFTP